MPRVREVGGRLSSVKAPPLLYEPPARSERWWNITEADIRLIVDELRKIGGGNGQQAGVIHYSLAKLGMPQTVTEWEKESMLAYLEGNRGTGLGAIMASAHLHLRVCGHGQEITPWEMEEMLKAGRTEPLIVYPIARSFPRSELLRDLKELGFPQDVTEDDRKYIVGHLDYHRKGKNAYAIAALHHFLKDLGIPQEITDEDRRLMREWLENARKNRRTDLLPEMLHHLKEIMPQTEGVDKTIPPLKRFKG